MGGWPGCESEEDCAYGSSVVGSVVAAVAVVITAAVVGSLLSSSSLAMSASSRPLDLRNSAFFSLLEFRTSSSCRNILARSRMVSLEGVSGLESSAG